MRRALMAVLLTLVTTPAAGQTKPNPLRTYETDYYVIHTDLGRDVAREAELRLTRMAEEYRRRTSAFSGEIRGKLPFYLFKSEADYHAAGGTPGTAGEYDPNARRLMAFAGDDGPNLRTWHAVQHEGFHQFADEVIGQDLPIWANEGVAEYFAEALFTGDSFVVGIVPQWRLARVRKTIESKGFMPLGELLGLPHKVWNQRISTTNYDHVWSFVHFLVHGDAGALRDRFTALLTKPGDGFERHVGRIDDVEAKWQAYWSSLPDDPTKDLYVEATLRTLTSFLARATVRRQRFDSFDAFRAAAERGELKAAESGWLPPSLLRDALKRAAAMQMDGAEFVLMPDPPRPPKLVHVAPGGTQRVGRFALKGSRVDRVTIEPAAAGSP